MPTVSKFFPLKSFGLARHSEYRVIPCSLSRGALRETRRRLHDTRRPCYGGDDNHCALCGGALSRRPRARLPPCGAAPQIARRPVSGHVEWRAPRALRPPTRDDRERVRRSRSRVAAVERASACVEPRRAGWRRERAPPRASRGAPRAGRTREPNRGGASSRASREESRGGGERVRAKRGIRVHPQLLQRVSDRRYAVATRFPPRWPPPRDSLDLASPRSRGTLDTLTDSPTHRRAFFQPTQTRLRLDSARVRAAAHGGGE